MNLKYEYDFYRYGNRCMAVADYEEAEKSCRLLWVNSCGKAIMEFFGKADQPR